MLINKENKLIFVTPYKTGSHTIQATILRSNFICHQHATYSMLKKQQPDLYEEVLDKYTKYLVVRNPWSHAVSHYMHNLEERFNPKLFKKDCSENYKASFKSFGNFLRSRHYIPQEDISFKDTLFNYDKVIKFENLNNELEDICNSIGIKYKLWYRNTGLDPKRNYFFNRVYPEDYKTLYNQEDIEFVRNRAKNEIKLFNYEF